MLFNGQGGRKARVINTSSWGHLIGSSFIGPGLEFDTFKDGPRRKKKGAFWLYTQSKFVRHHLVDELYQELEMSRPFLLTLTR